MSIGCPFSSCVQTRAANWSTASHKCRFPRATPGSYDVLDAATRDPRPDAAVLVCGSVYVAAEAREWAADRDPACLPADDWARVLRD